MNGHGIGVWGTPYRADRAIARDLLTFARFAGVIVAVAFDVARGAPRSSAVVAGIAIAYAVARIVRRSDGAATWMDVAVATSVLALTGGVASNYLLFALVCCIAAGLDRGPLAGLAGGAVVAAASLPTVEGGNVLWTAVAWFALFPIAGAGGGMLHGLFAAAERDAERVTTETNQTLVSLWRLARAMPAGLELGGTVSQVLATVRSRMRAPAAAVLVNGDLGLEIAGSYGISPEERLDLGPLLPMVGEPAQAFEIPGTAFAGCWLAAPVTRDSATIGMLLVACEHHGHGHERPLRAATKIAATSAVPLQNAILFRSIRELAIDEERNRIARDLHDGVAQSLTHLRFELELIARSALPDPLRDDVERLAAVTANTMMDVRAAIKGLRAGLPGGLAGALEAFVESLRRADGPTIVLRLDPDAHASPTVEAELFRVAQEAITNAIKHARARRIDVALERERHGIRLLVADDGEGIVSEREGGLGLDSMHERAARIGGRLRVGAAPGGGTRISLEVGRRVRSIA